MQLQLMCGDDQKKLLMHVEYIGIPHELHGLTMLLLDI